MKKRIVAALMSCMLAGHLYATQEVAVQAEQIVDTQVTEYKELLDLTIDMQVHNDAAAKDEIVVSEVNAQESEVDEELSTPDDEIEEEVICIEEKVETQEADQDSFLKGCKQSLNHATKGFIGSLASWSIGVIANKYRFDIISSPLAVGGLMLPIGAQVVPFIKALKSRKTKEAIGVVSTACLVIPLSVIVSGLYGWFVTIML